MVAGLKERGEPGGGVDGVAQGVGREAGDEGGLFAVGALFECGGLGGAAVGRRVSPGVVVADVRRRID